MPTVYIPQETVRRNANGDFEPVYDLSPALSYGSLEVLRSSMPVGIDEDLIGLLRGKMKEFGDDDYIVAIGDPAVIAAAIMVASRINNGRVKLLRWDRRTRQYLTTQLDAR